MADILTTAVSVLTLVTLGTGLYFAVVRFGLKRERATFLCITIKPTVVSHSRSTALVQILIRLENKGDTRINARVSRDVAEPSEFLYDDTWDQCEHAGTLKVRPVPSRDEAWVFDWYALQPMAATIERCTVNDKPSKVASRTGDLEQINYLGEYQDVLATYRDVDFWLEPRETYELTVPLWLPPGEYAAKAYFLGQRSERGEEEFWSSTTVFNVESAGAT